MLRGIFAFAALCCAAGPAAAAMDAPIRSVTVYGGTAMVQRELSLQPGRQHVEIVLPTNFAPDALRLESAEGITLGPLAIKDQVLETSADAREAALEKKIEGLQDQKKLLDIEVESANATKELLARMTLSTEETGSNGAPVRLDARGFVAILEQLRKADAEARMAIAKVELKQRDLDAQLAVATAELDGLRSNRHETRTLSFDVEAQQAGSVRVIYPQNGAGWQQAYRAVLDSGTGKLRLLRMALVRQQTGEDWSGVKLRLSTGQPQMAVSGPEPSPWMLVFGRIAPEGAPIATAMAEMRAAKPEPPPPASIVADGDGVMQEFEAFDTAFATEFSAPLPVTLKSDGTEVSLTLDERVLEGKMRLRVSPRQQATAYLEVEASRPDGDWLPGKMQLVRDNDYVGETFWQPQSHDKLLLPFGADSLVRVTHMRKLDRNGTTGLLGNHKEREVTDVFTIASNHKDALPLLVLDASPVATNDDIEVKSDFTPKPSVKDWEQRKGVMGWQLTLNPKSSVSVEAHHVITYPEDQVVGRLP